MPGEKNAKKNTARQGRPYEREQWLQVCKAKGVMKHMVLLGFAYLELGDLGASESARQVRDKIAQLLTEAGLPLPQEDCRLEEDPTDDDADEQEWANL